MGITVAVKVEHLPTANAPVTTPVSDRFRTVLVPNLDHHGTVKATLNTFIRDHLFIPETLQLLSAPLFTRLSEKDNVEDIYKRYACQADLDVSELHLDEDTFTMFGREGGRFVDLVDEKRLDDYHILDRTALQLKRLPHQLPDIGGRIFVETKDGILSLLGVTPSTHVAGLKHTLEELTGIPVAQQLLSSVGRVMHDEFIIKDFNGLHTVYEDSLLDLCKSEDSNNEQAHRRMVVFVNVMGEEEFTLVVQGRDSVLSILKLVESRTGIAPWQQRITYSGKVMQEKKTLGSYFVQPESTLHITMFKSPSKPPHSKSSYISEEKEELLEEALGRKPGARKLKLMRSSKGHLKGTLTIPVLTTDTVSDLKRKLRRTLQPLVERNFSPAKDQTHIEVTPKTPSMKTPESAKKQGERRTLSFESKNVGRSLSFSKLLTRSPNKPSVSPARNLPAVSSSPSPAFPAALKSTLCPLPLSPGASFSPRGSKSGPLLPRKALDEISPGQSPRHLPSAPSSGKLRFGEPKFQSSTSQRQFDLSQSSCRDLMPELLSLPDPDPKENHIHLLVRENTDYGNENNSKGRFGGLDKKNIKQWFSTGVESLKEHIRVLAVDG